MFCEARSRRMSAQKYNEMGDVLEISLEKIAGLLEGDYGLSGRCIALLMLQDDDEIITLIRGREPKAFAFIELIIEAVKDHYSQPLSYIIALRRQEEANRIVADVVEHLPSQKLGLRERLSRVMISPLTGVPFLLLVLYFGLYKFVGQFGAGTLVNFIEADIFEAHINPYIAKIFEQYIPWQVVRELFVGEYGMVTLGLRYAVALILPIVTTFFIVFAIIEDSGYLPRLALLIDRLFKKIGLTGRAVIPMVLGLGCDTMATMVTRTLPTKRERLIATILLALAVPCSAQLGVILALLSGNAAALWIWAIIVALVFLLIGFLSSKILPGDSPSFYMEIPPLRLPKISNVIIKTYTRVKWYFIEIMPMFILASFLIWLGLLTGAFGVLTKILEYPVHWAGLPDKAAVSFLFGFFRRDYGAGGLYFMQKEGLLNGNQLLVACVTLTLFLPCVAQFLMNVKERGLKTGIAISAFILVFSFSVGAAVNVILNVFGVHL
jgi:ferrous iron transport protein B